MGAHWTPGRSGDRTEGHTGSIISIAHRAILPIPTTTYPINELVTSPNAMWRKNAKDLPVLSAALAPQAVVVDAEVGGSAVAAQGRPTADTARVLHHRLTAVLAGDGVPSTLHHPYPDAAYREEGVSARAVTSSCGVPAPGSARPSPHNTVTSSGGAPSPSSTRTAPPRRGVTTTGSKGNALANSSGGAPSTCS